MYDKKEKFQSMEKFHFKHLGQLDKTHPIVIVYTEIYILEHKNAQKKILDELEILHNLDEKVSEIDSKERKQEPKNYITFGTGYEPIDDLGENEYFYTGKNLPLPFCYIKNLNPKEKLKTPIYMDWDFIEENFNKTKKVKVPYLIKAFVPNEKGELILTDENIIQSQKGILGEVLKKMTMLLLTGQGLVKMSLPVRIFDKCTQLQIIADFFSNLDYIHKATESNNKIERLKNIIVFVTSCVYYGINIKKPFNPYIGETLQGFYAEGTEIYVERIQHDPPKDSFFMINNEKKFKISGNLTLAPKLSTNELLIATVGVITVEIDGDIIYAELAEFLNKGMMMGKRKFLLKESFNFFYPNAGLKAIVHVGDDKKIDEFTGGIYQEKKNFQFNENNFKKTIFYEVKKKKFPKDILPISSISGSWYKKINFDGIEYWNSEQECYKVNLVKDVLPSDFRFREDLLWMIYENQTYAEQWKLALELEYREHRNEKAKHAKLLKKKK